MSFRRLSRVRCALIHTMIDVSSLTTHRSGGHTSESLALVSSLNFARYTPRTYIISEGDTLSAKKAVALEMSRSSDPATVRNIHYLALEDCLLMLASSSMRYWLCLVPAGYTNLYGQRRPQLYGRFYSAYTMLQ
jgi:hypothetical protein